MYKKLLLLLVLALGIYLGIKFTGSSFEWKKQKKVESSQIIVDRIRSVTKLTTVEGYFSELYTYKDYYWYDISPLRKKALLRMRARVSVGYDLGSVDINANAEEMRITLSGFPDPEILSIDHEMDYYDISQGTFNSFTEADYNELQKNAKNMIRQKVEESELFDRAEQQAIEVVDMIRFIVESSGWKIEIDSGGLVQSFLY